PEASPQPAASQPRPEYSAPWYALEPARPSSGPSSSLSAIVYPKGYLGSHSDAAFTKIPAICRTLPSRRSVNNRSPAQSVLGRNGSGVATARGREEEEQERTHALPSS